MSATAPSAASAATAAASELQAELAAAKARIEQFVEQNEASLQAAVTQHETVMRELEGAIVCVSPQALDETPTLRQHFLRGYTP